MATAVADLEAGLQAMLNLKPPGVSGSRITSLTSLCVSNIQSESVLLQKIYTHFKKAPGTHKLGVLYVVDSVTRKWLEQAKAQGQPVNSSAQDGTYAAGVHRVTELMPVLMNDILQSAPDEQKEKIKKLLDIWDKGQTFPAPMLESYRQKLNAAPPNASTTPPGSPPAGALASLQNKHPASTAPAPPNGSSILEALANMARQNTAANPGKPGPPAATASYAGMPQAAPSSMPQQQHQQPPSHALAAPPSYPPAAQSVHGSSMPFSLPPMPGQGAQPPAMPAAATNPYAAPAPAPGPGGVGLDSITQQQIVLIKALADQGVPFDKIPALIQSMTGASSASLQTAFQPPVPAAQGSYPTGQQPWGADNARERGFQDGNRSPSRYLGRSRSRSPDHGWAAHGSPRGGHDRLDYGQHEERERNGRRGNGYRQRSPQARRGRSSTPSSELPKVERWIEFDPNMPAGHIKVLSRTLFVGGVTCTEADLRNIFVRFGTVQTCIVNKEKRHAFVKMLTRKDAINAKDSTEDTRNLELPLRTRWGVGFGPRDCSDYATGISVIPIHKLTEADRKWMLTAPYGGSGGRPIESGMCVEEPDIEIGAGVSSKAISRRMQTDKGGSNGPKSTRGRDEDPGRGRRGRDSGGNHGRRGDNGDNGASGQQPPMPGFPFGMGSLPNGIPNFPAGFSYPDSGAGSGM
ncbi:RNA polymerase II-binding domain-containing protein [Hirsutella rhossiliensis]|uniref:RNA polymerase II-binding domain-containing protein n=1 Tax=Hirsutella rhossiliensis TaxID=111463 RepID=A0A9P8SLN0_9HYPO|nr:RNA polymerase II-binding domain-containing protein [Hirsutella rhossiliensis]KAH0966439.1 RNA polymerase II-binding domain-containing protein [Hirsutella rhossiliensis]